jgi:hypothetical protein
MRMTEDRLTKIARQYKTYGRKSTEDQMEGQLAFHFTGRTTATTTINPVLNTQFAYRKRKKKKKTMNQNDNF